jgi:hypothetical protein
MKQAPSRVPLGSGAWRSLSRAKPRETSDLQVMSFAPETAISERQANLLSLLYKLGHLDPNGFQYGKKVLCMLLHVIDSEHTNLMTEVNHPTIPAIIRGYRIPVP